MSHKNDDNQQYLKDWKEWQDNQYSPGHYLNGKTPLPLKQLGKKRWFRVVTIIYLVIFALGIIYALVQMAMFIK